MNQILQVTGLSKAFVQGTTHIPVLRNLEFRVNAGQTAAIVGPSGSGKSTLLSMLCGLDQPDAGSILVSGTDLAHLSESDLSIFRGANLGIIFQQYHLMRQLTALENVALPLQIHRRPDPFGHAEKLLKSVGLEKRMNHLPSQLSGGECQRVAIARAFVMQPKILIADEPSGSLDAGTGDTVMELLFEQVVAHSMTMVLVTHNEELASRCDEIFALRDGQLYQQNKRERH
jgi:putative ABC transport system ATP-binding protein